MISGSVLKQYSQAVASFEQALRYKSDYQEASKGKKQALQAADLKIDAETHRTRRRTGHSRNEFSYMVVKIFQRELPWSLLPWGFLPPNSCLLRLATN
ncbi:MAG: hypothetical protein F6K47_11965 [Symploca sp. SIO2E6]|nr:hypothetical protein [Symploca sp. SIO2E6]